MSQFTTETVSSTATAGPTLPVPAVDKSSAAASHTGGTQKDSAETLIYYHTAFQLHNMGADHVERPARTRVISNRLHNELAKPGKAGWRAPRLATDEELMRFHTPEYVKEMHEIFDEAESTGEPQEIDGDTTAMEHTREAALRGAGAVCQAVEEVMSGRAKNAFCVVRPPGHHAEPDKCMGFCFFNNLGVGVQHARKMFGIKRVAVVDFDVHHGNGTQAGFRADPDVLFVSSHEGEDDFYPGTGSAEDTGVNNNVLNLPMEEDDGSEVFRQLFSMVAIPAIEAFAPEMIFISAGFDAHDLDPLADIELKDEDYEWVTQELAGLAARHCKGRLVSVLEGGYSLEALASAPLAHVNVLVNAITTGEPLGTAAEASDAAAAGAAAYAALVADAAKANAVLAAASEQEALADVLERQKLGKDSLEGNLQDAIDGMDALAVDGTEFTEKQG